MHTARRVRRDVDVLGFPSLGELEQLLLRPARTSCDLLAPRVSGTVGAAGDRAPTHAPLLVHCAVLHQRRFHGSTSQPGCRSQEGGRESKSTPRTESNAATARRSGRVEVVRGPAARAGGCGCGEPPARHATPGRQDE